MPSGRGGKFFERRIIMSKIIIGLEDVNGSISISAEGLTIKGDETFIISSKGITRK
jgi:hypothetical protein